MFSFPNAPTEGQIFKPTGDITYVYRAPAWKIVDTSGTATIWPAPPANPNPGDLWWENDTGDLFVWYQDADSAAWVQVNTTGPVDAPSQVDYWVTPQMYGAKADGIADDTAAIQAALNTTARHIHFPSGNYRIVDTLQNGVPTLVSTLHKRRITCDGTIIATGHVYVALRVDGDDNAIQINIDGGNNVAHALSVYGARPAIEGCRIENLRTTVFSSVGIRAETQTGGLIRGNIVRNIESVGDLSRAVLMVCNVGDATDQFTIADNILTNVIGAEGDTIAIAGSAGDGVTYYNAKVVIRGNTITRFNRRAIKLQASDCQTIDNTIRNDWTNISQVPNRSSVINLTQGNNHTVRGNLIENCDWFPGIVLSGVAPENFSNIVIEGNILRGVEDTSQAVAAISITPLGSNLYVRNNVVHGYFGRSITVGGATNVVIDGNLVSPLDNAAERTISVTSTCVNVVVTNNVMLAGSRRSFIEIDAADPVVANNHCRALGSTTMAVRGPGNKNMLVVGNTAMGAGVITNDYAGGRLGANYVQGNPQSNFHPGPMYAVTAGGPATQMAGVYVQVGQIVFDTSPTAGGKIGWVAMTAGLAEAVTWKPFGAIDA